MTLWFGPFIDLEPAHGYFHLCPSCYRELVEPELEAVQGRLAHLHPTVAAYLERERQEDAGAAEDAAEDEMPRERAGGD